MFVIHSTRKFLDRVCGPDVSDSDATTSPFGS